MSEQQDKPKIIVDDNWKERVQAEKEAFRQKSQSPTEDDRAPPAEEPRHDVPPASFPLLVTSVATQVLAALGQIPDAEKNPPTVRLDVARHHIDILSILEEKTQGNLTPEESEMMSNILHELRMLFMSVQSQGASASPKA